MASITTVRAILTAIRRGAHSVSVQQIHEDARVAEATVTEVLRELIREGYVKQHTQNRGTYFTFKSERDLINTFIAGSDVLPGFFEEAAAEAPVSASYTSPRGTTATVILLRSILAKFRGEPHAFNVPPLDAYLPADVTAGLTILLDNKLIKADGRGIGYYTRKPMRTKIDSFLADGPVTLVDLMDPSIKNLPVYVPPTPEVNHATTCETPGAFNTFINELNAARDAHQVSVDAIIERYLHRS